MPKLKIEAKKVLDDIRAGLDDAALMEKYNLSTKGLHSVLEKLVALKALNESYIWTGRPPREQGPPSPPRELSAKEVSRDIKSGVTDGELMRKYRLSAKGLQNLLEQMLEAGVIKQSDLEFGKPLMESTVELTSDMLPPLREVEPEGKVPTSLSAENGLAQSEEGSTPPEEIAPPPAPPQQVHLVESVEYDFPSTVPITAVAEPENGEAVSSTGASAESPRDDERQEPQIPTPIAGLEDLSAVTAPASSTTDERPVEESPAAGAPPVGSETPPEQAPGGDHTLKLVWKCPACGQPQTRAYQECPACGIVVDKFLVQKKGQPEPEKSIAREAPHSTEPAPPAPEPPAPVPLAPKLSGESRAVQPEQRKRSKPRPPRLPVTPEEVPRNSDSISGYLSRTLSGMAIGQLALVLVYVGIRLFAERHRLFTADVLVWAFAAPILISSLVCVLLHAAGVLVRLGTEILTAAEKNRILLREILRKIDRDGT